MATIITSECINCGACEPECPNTAIYAGAVEWEMGGESHPAIAQDIYYIVASKCTECVGFYDHEACAAVCPVDCCVPDPNNLESEQVLIERAQVLHPEQSFGADFPSRFRKEGGEAAASNGAAAGPAPDGVAAADGLADGPVAKPAAPAAKPAAAAPPKPAPAAASAKPAAAPAAAKPATAPAAQTQGRVPGPAAMLNLPKDLGALPGPIGEKHFPGEVEEDFETALGWVDPRPVRGAPAPLVVAMRLAEPLLGAMPNKAKDELQDAVGNPAGFSRVRCTALNITLNVLLYPAILTAFGVVVMGDKLFSQDTSGWITLGMLIAVVETCWRLREGILQARPASELTYRGCLYGLLLTPLAKVLARGCEARDRNVRRVAFDGFTTDLHDEKIERDRRYGTVYAVTEQANAHLVRLEMPRRIPSSSLKRLWNLPDEMPDYDYSIALEDSVLSISASLRGEALRRLSYISSSFPADFATRIEFANPVTTFKHRLRDKVLEIIVFKNEIGELKDGARQLSDAA